MTILCIPSYALLGSVEVGLGYDSNPTLTSSNKDADGFSAINAILTQGVSLYKSFLFSIEIQGEGRKYYEGQWDSLLSARGELSYLSSDGAFQPSIFFMGTAVRTKTTPEDDRDAATLGSDLQFYLLNDIGIGCGISFEWLDFRRNSSILGSRFFTGGPMGYGNMRENIGVTSSLKSGPFLMSISHMDDERLQPAINHIMESPIMNQQRMDALQGISQRRKGLMRFARARRKARDNRFETIYLSAQKDLISNLTLSLTFIRERLFSELRYESFTRYGIGAGITVFLPKKIEVSGTFFWKRARFKKTRFGNRTDYTRHVFLELVRSFKQFGVSLSYDCSVNNSSFDFEDYRKDLTTINFSYYF